MGQGDVADNNICYTVEFAAKLLHDPVHGILLDRIDTHSLRSGGVCALALIGYKEMDIMKVGR